MVGHVARMKSTAYKVLAAQPERDSLEDLSLDAITN
jgi:hypothetical protein